MLIKRPTKLSPRAAEFFVADLAKFLKASASEETGSANGEAEQSKEEGANGNSSDRGSPKSRKSQQKRAFESRGTGGGNGPRSLRPDIDQIKDAMERISRDAEDPTVVQAAAEAVAAVEAVKKAEEAAKASQSLWDGFRF